MPYRHAHWYVLALLPLAAAAFWTSYVTQFATASSEFHTHGITATLWVLLLAAQSWSIHAGRRMLHRRLGLVSLALFPLFLVGGVGIFLGMAQRFAGEVSPFHLLYAPRLAWVDVVAVAGFAAFYFQALRRRREVAVHAGYLLATAIFLLPPILGRLSAVLPFLSVSGPADFGKLAIGFQLSHGVTIAIALLIAARAKGNGRPFVEAAGLTALMAVLFQFAGPVPAWQALFGRFAALPFAPSALAVLVVGVGIAWAGWQAGRRRPRAGLAAA